MVSGVAILAAQIGFAADEEVTEVQKVATEIRGSIEFCKDLSSHKLSKTETYTGVVIGMAQSLKIEEDKKCGNDPELKKFRDSWVTAFQTQKLNLVISTEDDSALLKEEALGKPEDESKAACELEIGNADKKPPMTGSFGSDKKFTIAGIRTIQKNTNPNDASVLAIVATHEGTYSVDEKKKTMQITSEKNEFRFITSLNGAVKADCKVTAVANPEGGKEKGKGAPGPGTGNNTQAAAPQAEKPAPKSNKGCSATGGGGPSLMIVGVLTGLLAFRKRSLHPVAKVFIK